MYELSLDPVAEEQIKAVPQEALRPLAELFTLLETAPWSGEPFNPANPRGNEPPVCASSGWLLMFICVLACRAGWGRPGARQADAAGRLSAVFVPGPTRLTLGHRESNLVALVSQPGIR